MLCTNMVRVATAGFWLLLSSAMIEAPATAATILLPVQKSVEIDADRDPKAMAGQPSRAVNQAAFLPLDDDDAIMWALLVGGIAVIGIGARSRRRMPSVTS